MKKMEVETKKEKLYFGLVEGIETIEKYWNYSIIDSSLQHTEKVSITTVYIIDRDNKENTFTCTEFINIENGKSVELCKENLHSIYNYFVYGKKNYFVIMQ